MPLYFALAMRLPSASSHTKGQSLVEMVLIFPILILLLVGGASFGIGLYQANMASDAIRQPALKKMEMANNPNAVPTGVVMGWVTGGDGIKGSMKAGSGAIDKVAFANGSAETSIIVGTKNYQSLASFLPGLTITVAQGINKNLLLPASNGTARTRSATEAWVPGGAPRTPPWMNPAFNHNIPPDVQINPNCAMSPVGDSTLNALNTDTKADKTYISRKPEAFFSPVSEQSLIQMARTFAGECENEGKSACQQEYDDLLPDPPKDQPAKLKQQTGTPPDPVYYTYEVKNPPGGPGTILTYEIVCSKEQAASSADGKNCKMSDQTTRSVKPNPAIGPNHGMYYDPDGKYEKPPNDFVSSCTSRKQAECMLKKASDRASDLVSAYGDACKF